MLRIVNYCVVEDEDGYKLRGKVLDLVRQGWEPQGGVSCALINLDHFWRARWYYVQAMVKRPAVSPGRPPRRTRTLSEDVYVINPEEEDEREADE